MDYKAGRGDTLWITLLAAVAYAALRQDAVHHLDMHGVVRSVVAPAGEGARYGHFGFQWLALLLHEVLGTDEPLFRPLQWCSVFGAALAVGAGHRACLAVGLPRARAALAALGAAATGVAVFFATTAEIHAVFWLPTNLGWWALATALRRDGAIRALQAGLAFGVAAAVHSSGHLLPLLAVLGVLACPRDAMRWPGAVRRLETPVCVFLGHAVAFGVLRGADAMFFGYASDAASQGFLHETLARWQGFGALPGLAWREWLLPYFPFCLAPLLALPYRAMHLAGAALLVAVLGYLAVDLALLIGLVEHGAYALPLVVPAAALMVRPFGGLGGFVLMVMAGAATMTTWKVDPTRVPKPEFAGDLQSWVDANPGNTVVLGGYAEIDSVLVFGAPLWHHTILEPEFVVWLKPDTADAQVRAGLRAQVERAARHGGGLLLSREAAALFASLPRNLAILVDVNEDLEVREVRQGAFGGRLVTLRRGG